MTLDQQIAALQDAIASGARRVRTQTPGGVKEVEYHSLAEMMNALAALQARKADASGTRAPRVSLGYFTRG